MTENTESDIAPQAPTSHRGPDAVPERSTFPGLFHLACQRHADQPALTTDRISWSYSELGARVQATANRLIEAGVQPYGMVGVSAERSPDLVVALLAVMHVGASYVALAPSLPRERLRLMAEDAGVDVLLGDPDGLAACSSWSTAVALEICVDDIAPGGLDEPVPMSPLGLAYVLYTSGTTGRPKGVAIPQWALAHLSAGFGRDPLALDDEPRVFAVKASYTFDLFVGEMFPPLAAGATLAIVPDGVDRDPRALVRFLELTDTTDMWSTPTLLAMLEEIQLPLPDSLRRVYSGGEALNRDLATRVQNRGLDLWNLYGPTEMCCGQTGALVPPDPAPITIGAPSPNHAVEIFDRLGEPQLVGGEGEIAIAGPGEAWGYLGMPRRTALSFVPSLMGGGSGGRMYVTGDIATWNEDGEILYKGRRDNQLQVRGVRIELGEVEGAVGALPGISLATILPSNATEGRADGLVAYCVASDETPDVPQLKRRLGESLPDAAIPSRFVFLDSMPYTSSGKVDARALAAIPVEDDEPTTDSELEAMSLDEAIVATIWKRHLGLPKIGPHTDFYTVGGHSVLAIRVLTEVESRFGKVVDLVGFTREPTIRGLARAVREEGAPSEAPIEPTGETVGPLSSSQRQMWFLHQMDGTGYLIPHVVRLKGPLDVGALERSVRSIVERHAPLRTVYPATHGEPSQRVLPAMRDSQWTMEHVGDVDPALRIRQAVLQRPFDLPDEPGFRAHLFEVDPSDHILVLLFNHICVDDWALKIFLNELEASYELERRDATPLPDPLVTFVDYARWENARLQTDAFARDISWWRERLADAPDHIDWPWDGGGPGARPATTVEVEVPAAEARAIDAAARKLGATSAAYYVGLLAGTLSALTEQRDLVVGMPVTERTRPELQNLIGMFVNTLPLRVQLPESASLRDAVDRAAQSWLTSMEHGWVPLNEIVAATGSRAAAGGAPFDVLVNFLAARPWQRSLGEAVMEDVDLDLEGIHYPMVATILASDAGHTVRLTFQSERFDERAREIVRTGFVAALEHVGREADLQLRPDRVWSERVAKDLSRTSPAKIRKQLRELLPAALVPAEIVFVDDFPRLPSGKVDRTALANLRPGPRTAGELVAPRTETEKKIAAIWQEMLDRPVIGIHENLFEIGGHSLLAVRIQHRISAEFGVEVPLGEFLAHPSIAGLAEWIDQGGGASVIQIPTGAYDDEAPVSSEQRRMWFLQQLHPTSAAYNVPIAFELEGDYRSEAMHAAVKHLVARHEVLRTVYTAKGGQPVQHILPADVDVPWRTEQATPEELDAAIRRRAFRPFALDSELPIAVTEFELGPQRHLLLVVLHHIAIDEWTAGVMVGELAELYAAAVAGRPTVLPPLTLQYADYAIWQGERRKTAEFEEGLQFWRSSLEGAPARIDYPLGREPSSDSRPAGTATFDWSPEVSDAVRKLGREAGTTDFVSLYALFAAFLGRFTGQADFVVGIPTTMRSEVGLQNVIGFLLNTLPVRTRTAPESDFENWLRQIRDSWHASLERQFVPLDEIVRATGGDRADSAAPLFDTMFTFLPEGATAGDFGGLDARPVDIEVATDAKATLVASITVSDDRFVGTVEYDAARFDADEIRTLTGQFSRFVRQCVEQPHRPIAAHSLLPPEDGARVRRLAAGKAVAPDGDFFMDLFEAHARRTPHHTALRGHEIVWTYAELNERANAIAHALIERGVGPEVPVGVAMNNSPELIATLLGVLKAGGPFVSLAPTLPTGRLQFMASDSKTHLVIVDEAGREAFAGADLEVLPWEQLPAQTSLPSPTPELDAHNLAYVIYTSGTTGRPKGVAMPHRGLASYASMIPDLVFRSRTPTVLAKASYTFDMFVAEVFPTFAAGGTLAVGEPGVERRPDDLHATLAALEVTDLWITPTNLRLLSETRESMTELPLRQLLVGGEAMTHDIAELVTRTWGRRLWNMYGPTEMCVSQTGLRLDSPIDGVTPIGYPHPGQNVVVLDPAGELRSLGLRGEIAIGGPGEARGYLGMPRRTATAFLPSSVSDTAKGSRLYRTGDVGAWREDGAIDYLGRIDHQLQVRGVRVELSELEGLLESVPAIRNAAVCPVDESAGRADSLVAFLVLHPTRTVSSNELRKHLGAHVQEAVIPGRFVFLDEMPTNSSGKTDRRALLELDLDEENIEMLEVTLPRTPTEKAIAEIWMTHLGVPRVGVHQSFFALGGHSLLAVRVQQDISEHFGIELTLVDFLDRATVAALAEFIDGTGDRLRTRIEKQDYHDEAPVSSEQRRMWFLQKLHPQSAAYNVPIGMALEGAYDEAVMKEAVAALTARHEILRTVYPSRDGEPIQKILPARTPVTWVTHVAESSDEADAVVRQALARPFDLESDPPLRAFQIKRSTTRHDLLFVIHHIAIDEWAMGQLVGELAELYAAARASREPLLPSPSIQYADYAIWQGERLRGEPFEEGIAYWKEHLRDANNKIQFPFGREVEDPHRTAGVVSFRWSDETSSAVRALARRSRTTEFVALYALFTAFLARRTGQFDLTVGLPVTLRESPELRTMVGFCLNTIPLRALPRPDEGIGSWLERARDVWRRAAEHQWIPLEEIVRATGRTRSEVNEPLFDTMFTFVPASSGEGDFADLRATLLETGELPQAKAALMLGMSAKEERFDGALEFDAHRFDRGAMEKLVQEFSRFVRSSVEAPDQPLASVEILESAERDHVARDLASSPPLAEPVHSVLALFDSWVESSPDGVALRTGAEEWTYERLGNAVNTLAGHLRNLGVRRNDVVGVSLDRSPELVVAVLAISKAGGAYVALEPGLPAERLSYMLQNSGARWAVVDAAGHQALASLDVETVDIGAVQLERPTESLELTEDEDDLAYILYTSGSTGRPKGVMIPRGAMWSHIAAMNARLPVRPDDVVLQKTSIGFDVSMPEIFQPLTSGAALAIASSAADQDPTVLAENVHDFAVTDMRIVPTLLAELLQRPTFGRNDALRRVISAGEALTPVVRDTFLERTTAELWNQWGPTETTVYGTIWQCSGDDPPRAVPIGYPLTGKRLHVLDACLELAPVGTQGELCVGGDELAWGYRMKARQTALSFVPDPFASKTGARLYRSGDLVRWAPDGWIDYLGRRDNQIQLRGIRIELGEIEAHLERAPRVQSAAVVAIDVVEGRAEALRAYVVAIPGETLDAGELRRHLLGHLSASVIPSTFVQIDAMPTTASGKTDRRALGASVGDGALRSKTRVNPRNATEERVAKIWREHLGLAEIGVHESFFELGGHSLLAVRVQDALSDEFEINIPLHLFFSRDTIADLSDFIDAASTSSDGLEERTLVVPLAEGAEKTAIVLVHPIGGTLFGYRQLVRALGPEANVVGIRSPGTWGDELPSTMEELARTYVSRLRATVKSDRYVLAGWSFGGVVAFAMAAELRQAGVDVEQLVLIDSYAPGAQSAEEPSFEGFVFDLGRTLGIGIPQMLEWQQRRAEVGRQDDFEQLALRLEESGFAAFDAPNLRRLYYVWSTHIALYQDYQPPTYDGAVHSWAADPSGENGERGWRSLVVGDFTQTVVATDHYGVVASTNIEALANELR